MHQAIRLACCINATGIVACPKPVRGSSSAEIIQSHWTSCSYNKSLEQSLYRAHPSAQLEKFTKLLKIVEHKTAQMMKGSTAVGKC